MSSSFYMILDMLVAMADLGYGGPWLWRAVSKVGVKAANADNNAVVFDADNNMLL